MIANNLLMAFLFGAISIIGGCSDPSDSKLQQHVNDQGFTLDIDNNHFSYDAVGYITNGIDHCFGFAFSNYKIATALHCLSPDFKLPASFETASGDSLAIKNFTPHYNSDVAVFELSEPTSYFPAASIDLSRKPRGQVIIPNTVLDVDNFHLLSSQGGYVYLDTESKAGSVGTLTHTINTNYGHSGAPILDENFNLIGIHLGGVKEERLNYGVSIEFSDSAMIDDDAALILECDNPGAYRNCMLRCGSGPSKWACRKACGRHCGGGGGGPGSGEYIL